MKGNFGQRSGETNGEVKRFCAGNLDITIRDKEVDHGWSQKQSKEETFAQLERQS